MTTMTPQDAIKAASSIARDVADGRLSPAALEQQAASECRELFGTVAGPGDPLWALHLDVARQVLALDGVPADELAEWLAVTRHRAGEPVSQPVPEVIGDMPDPDPEPEPAAEPHQESVADADQQPATKSPQRTGRYDPLAGWSPGGSRRS